MKSISTRKGNVTLVILLAAAIGIGAAFFADTHRIAQEHSSGVTAERLETAINTVSQMKADADMAALGATNKIPDLRALYEDTLASKITNTATSFTLARGTSAGVSLASSTYPFIIDEGTSIEEMVLADCTGTTCTNVTRGLSFTTGTTTVNSLRFAHGRGASVKITDGPVLLIHNRLLQGVDTFPNLLSYQSGTACDSATAGGKICDINYIRNIASSGGATSTESRGGFVELATASEQSSGFYGGVDVPTVLQSKNSSSTPTIGCDGSVTIGKWCVPSTKSNGKLWQGWFDLTEHFNFSSLFATNASSTNATTTATHSIGTLDVTTAADFTGASVTGLLQPATTTAYIANGTWTKPAGANRVEVYAWAGGGGGGGGAGGGDGSNGGGEGGGGGAFCFRSYLASELDATEAVTIGAAGTGGPGGLNGSGTVGVTGGNSVFADGGDIVTANGGVGGDPGTTAAAGTGAGTGGTCSTSGDTYDQGAYNGQAGGDAGFTNNPGTAGTGATTLSGGAGGGGGGGADGLTNEAGGAGGTIVHTTFRTAFGFPGEFNGLAKHPLGYMLDADAGAGGAVSSSGEIGANGVAGSFPGGGGGGGGAEATDNGFGDDTGGTGGTAGAGLVIVITYF